jgi:hypothetical protein
MRRRKVGDNDNAGSPNAMRATTTERSLTKVIGALEGGQFEHEKKKIEKLGILPLSHHARDIIRILSNR